MSRSAEIELLWESIRACQCVRTCAKCCRTRDRLTVLYLERDLALEEAR